MRKQRAYDRDIVVLLVFSLITLSTWVGFEVYHAYTQVEIPEVTTKMLRPLDPNLNTAVLSDLTSRLP